VGQFHLGWPRENPGYAGLDEKQVAVRADTLEHQLTNLELPAELARLYRGASVGHTVRVAGEPVLGFLDRSAATMRERKLARRPRFRMTLGRTMNHPTRLRSAISSPFRFEQLLARFGNGWFLADSGAMPEEATTAAPADGGETPVEQLEKLGVRGILMQLARDGQLIGVRCEMPQCYSFRGRKHFDPRGPDSDWEPTADHYPRLKMHGGLLRPDNVRLGHRLCNRRDYEWRTRIAAMLGKRMSLKKIADELNQENVPTIHGTNEWTPASVRKAFVS
jgi:hypothetical protein